MTLPLTPIPEPQSADYPGHTPGPWYKTKDGKSVCSKHSIYGPVSVTVADCFVSKILDFSEMNANTILIAAAPDLRHALQEAIKSLKWCKMVYGGDWPESAGIVEVISDGEKALSKAKGKL